MSRTRKNAAVPSSPEIAAQVSLPAVRSGDDSSTPWFQRPVVHIVFVLLLGLAAYSNTFNVPFVFDDFGSIVENEVVHDLWKFLSGAGYGYNPHRFIGYLTFALNYHFGGLNVVGYHVVNLAIHLINASVLYWLVRLILSTPFFSDRGSGTGDQESPVRCSPFTDYRSLIPLFTALLFVVHPVQTQAVTYIVQRLASMAAMFYLLTLVFYLKGRMGDLAAGKWLTARGGCWYFLSIVSAVLALRTKENAFTLPFALGLIEFSFFRAGLKRRLIALVPAILMVIVVLFEVMKSGKPLGAWLSDVTEKLTAADNVSRGEYLINQFRVVITYIRLLFFPVGQNLDYDYPIFRSFFEPEVFFSFLFLVTLFGLAIYLYYRTRPSPFTLPLHSSPFTGPYRLIGFGILWFFLTLSIESSFIPIADFIFEHRLYLPAVGPFLAISVLVLQAMSRFSYKIVTGAMVAVCLILAVATWQRNVVWGSAISLWSDVIEKAPGTVRGRVNLGITFEKAGRMDDALEQMEGALVASKNFENDPPYLAKLNNSIGVLYNKKNWVDKAYERLQAAVSLDQGNAAAHSNLALVLGKKGLLDQSIEQSKIALQLKPGFAEPYKNLGTAYLVKGQLPEAARYLEKAVALDPKLAEAYNNLGSVYLKMGQSGKAIEKYQESLRLKPDQPGLKENLALALEMQKSR